MWILIVISFSHTTGAHIDKQDFDTKFKCDTAAQLLIDSGYYTRKQVLCVEK